MKLEDLEIYQLAEELSDITWDVVQEWEWYHQNAFGWQMVRSADSVSANIAEAHGRFTFRERRRFCIIARGSLFEYDTWLGKTDRRGLIDETRLAAADGLSQKLHWKVNRYIASLERNAASLERDNHQSRPEMHPGIGNNACLDRNAASPDRDHQQFRPEMHPGIGNNACLGPKHRD